MPSYVGWYLKLQVYHPYFTRLLNDWQVSSIYFNVKLSIASGIKITEQDLCFYKDFVSHLPSVYPRLKA